MVDPPETVANRILGREGNSVTADPLKLSEQAPKRFTTDLTHSTDRHVGTAVTEHDGPAGIDIDVLMQDSNTTFIRVISVIRGRSEHSSSLLRDLTPSPRLSRRTKRSVLRSSNSD